jgi:hypothetical protein
MFAFLASLLGLVAAAFRVHGSAHPGEGHGENCQQSDRLHIDVTYLCLARLHESSKRTVTLPGVMPLELRDLTLNCPNWLVL